MRFPKVSAYVNSNGIPTKYTEVEYIESTGTQWINTGVIPTKDIGASMRFYITGAGPSGGDSCMLMSGGDVPGYRWGYSYRVTGGTLQVSGVMKAGISWENYAMAVGSAHSVDYNFTDQADCYLDGTLIRSDIPGGDATQENPIYLFCSNDGTETIWRPGNFRVYYLKISDKGKVIRDFVPVLDESNKPGLYEKISGTIYYNQASSGNDFSYGKKITYINYLQSSGTQYIDTGFMPNNNTKVDLVGKFNTTYPCCLWATRWSGSPDYDTYGAYAENNSAGMLYIYCGKYSAGNFTGVDNATFPHRDGNYIRFIQDKNKVNFTNLGTGTNWTYTFAEETFQSTRNLALFYFSSPSAFNTKGGYIKSCKIYNNGIIVRDFVAVRDENNVGYMFDKLGHALYANAGSGTFTLGEDIVCAKSPVKLIKAETTTSGLPTNYTEVEYLESTGTQYIDTKLSMSNGFRTTGSYLITTLNNTGGIIGTYTNTSPYKRNFYDYTYGSGNRWLVGYGGDAYQYFGTLSSNTLYTFDISNILNKEHLIINGTAYTISPTGTRGIKIDYDLYVFALNVDNTPNNYSKIKLFKLKVYDENDILRRDYIPALDPTGRPCLYDKVDGKPYYNQGTGEFSYGKQITPIEYLEATGTQYINTGLKVTSNTRTELDYQMTDVSWGTNGIWGASTGQTLQFITQTNNAKFVFQWTPDSVKNIGIKNLFRHKFVFDVPNKVFKVDNYVESMAGFTFSMPTGNVMLFANGHLSVKGKLKIYGYRHYESDVKILDLIPVKDENDVGYLFDKVSHTLYTNAGTGSFTLGNTKKIYNARIIGSLVPSKYTEVKCLVSDGTQYIDTGITGNNNTKIDILFSKKNTTASYINGIVGARGSGVNVNNIVVGINDAQIAIDFVNGGSGSYATYRYIVNNTLEDVKYRAIASKTERSLYQGDTLVGQSTALNSQTINTTNLWMFGVQNYGFTEAKIYYCKIWDDGVLVRNFRPVIRNSDSKPGMWDRVSNTFFTNIATSVNDFTYELI